MNTLSNLLIFYDILIRETVLLRRNKKKSFIHQESSDIQDKSNVTIYTVFESTVRTDTAFLRNVNTINHRCQIKIMKKILDNK